MTRLFQLRLFLRRNEPRVIVNCYHDGFDSRGAYKYQLEVRQGGKVIFPVDGPLHGTYFPCWSSDGPNAKEHTLNHLSIKPGDTDDDFFANYTPEQLAFVEKYGEDISCEKERRYCDENGNVR